MTGGFDRRGITSGFAFSGGTVTIAFLAGAALFPLAGTGVLLLFCATASGEHSRRSNARMKSERTRTTPPRITSPEEGTRSFRAPWGSINCVVNLESPVSHGGLRRKARARVILRHQEAAGSEIVVKDCKETRRRDEDEG